jgi:hypothetical protein
MSDSNLGASVPAINPVGMFRRTPKHGCGHQMSSGSSSTHYHLCCSANYRGLVGWRQAIHTTDRQFCKRVDRGDACSKDLGVVYALYDTQQSRVKGESESKICL